jgi:hypothetical protein
MTFDSPYEVARIRVTVEVGRKAGLYISLAILNPHCDGTSKVVCK